MVERPFWIQKIEEGWRRRSLVWLSGVRRIGKTCLSHQLGEVRYLNCELPSVQRQLADPEFFLAQQSADTPLVFDEIHRLSDPSVVLKIAADSFPGLRILATGSSTLQATTKFRDSLTGRKHSVHLPPVLWRECLTQFGIRDLDRRLHRGGFPEVLLAGELDPVVFEEWIDSFYARDIQELFGVRNRTGFLALLRLICFRSGGQLNVTDLAKESGLTRPTVLSHLESLEIAHALTRVPPFHGASPRGVTRRPRVYAFDTGLVAHVRGWTSLRETDRGPLWEHLVLDELRAAHSAATVSYWRDKAGREVDFVVPLSSGKVAAVEAKMNPSAFRATNLRAFRQLYPQGSNYLVCPLVDEPYQLRKGELVIRVCGPEQFPLE